MVSIGAVRIVQGSGIYINPGVSSNPLVYNSITEKKFTDISFKMLELHKRRPDKEEQQVFGLTRDDFIWAFTRLRRINQRRLESVGGLSLRFSGVAKAIPPATMLASDSRSEEHTSELQSRTQISRA